MIMSRSRALLQQKVPFAGSGGSAPLFDPGDNLVCGYKNQKLSKMFVMVQDGSYVTYQVNTKCFDMILIGSGTVFDLEVPFGGGG